MLSQLTVQWLFVVVVFVIILKALGLYETGRLRHVAFDCPQQTLDLGLKREAFIPPLSHAPLFPFH